MAALLVIAVLIGVVTGFLAIGFRYLLFGAIELFWGDAIDVIGAARAMRWYAVMTLPVLGGLLIAPIIARWAPETRGAGVPEVIETIVARDGVIRHRTTFFKILSTVLSIGTGASVGREGPVVHIGASIGSSIAQVIGLAPEWRRVFVASGAAAGIAATFNAPMAGMLFAAEIILVDFQVSYLSHIAVSAITATVISFHFLGTLPAFIVPHYTLVSYLEIPGYILLGVAAGFASILFTKTVTYVEDLFGYIKTPAFLRPAVGGFLVGLIAIFMPHVLGVGYESVNLVLTAKTAALAMTGVLVFKLLATSLSVGSGFSGGIFAPSLVMGSMLGGILGSVVHGLFPDLTAAYPAYSLVGMGAVVAGTTLAPITAILTIFELTYDFEIILPLMTSCISSLLVVHHYYGYSFYETKLLRRGVRIVRGRDINILRSMRVGDYMERDFESVREDTPLGALIARMEKSHYPHFPVLDRKGNLVGIISMTDLKPILADMKELCQLLVTAEIMTKNVYTLTPEDNFEKAFDVFEKKQISTLPVVSRRNRKKIIGILKKSTLIEAYNQKVLKSGTIEW